MVSAVIVAAGKGTRMNHSSNLSKQYIDILGKTVVLRTLEKFIKSEVIDEIVIVIMKAEETYFKENVLSKIDTKKPIKLVHGGSERFESSYNGIIATSETSDIVLIHDGVRPFVKLEEISNMVEAVKKFDAAVLAVKSKDTIKLAVDNIIEETPNRENVYMIQTPQGFKRNLLIEAYQHMRTSKDDFMPTDDASVVERYGTKVHIVEGSYENIKITTASDIYFAEAIIKMEN
ncbi:MAG: 2-C-methyl-D-erythritol 4-phosphate cytidylyltransferase [Proteocatella sp.]